MRPSHAIGRVTGLSVRLPRYGVGQGVLDAEKSGNPWSAKLTAVLTLPRSLYPFSQPLASIFGLLRGLELRPFRSLHRPEQSSVPQMLRGRITHCLSPLLNTSSPILM